MKTLIFLIAFSSFYVCYTKGVSSNRKGVCLRQEKFTVIGYDNNADVEVDVGECKTATPETSADQANKTNNECIVLSTREERRLLFDGHHVIKTEIIETCQKVPSTCQRLPRMITFYPGTVTSTKIDVGLCGGQCQGGFACKAVWTKSLAIAGPNGNRLIPIITNCSCVQPHCYRKVHFESFPEEYIDAKGNTASRIKLVDMGKCVSEKMCPLKQLNRRGHFLPLSRCGADKVTYKNHSFVTSGGRRVNISAIGTCSCKD